MADGAAIEGDDHEVAGWAAFQRRRAALRPPLRPTAEVVAAMRRLTAPAAGPTLILGLTPELLASVGEWLAADWSATAIADARAAESPRRRCLQADWRALPITPASCGAAIGDGSLSCLAWPGDYGRLSAELARVLAPGAVVAIRCYATPDEGERIGDVAAAALAGAGGGFHAFKWRLAMALAAAHGPNLPVSAIADAFDALLPDRAALAAAAGWSLDQIAEIDAYQGSALAYSFPTRRQILGAIGPGFVAARFIETEGYELAERCPLLVLERAAR